jgi:2-oxoglutarate ferredoxin oxidoreductase subunit gamma
MNAASAPAFQERVATEGLLLVEATDLTQAPQVAREDLRIEQVSAVEAARQLGQPRNANLVMMGAYVALTQTVAPDLVEAQMVESFRDKGMSESAITVGKAAFAKGGDLVANST